MIKEFSNAVSERIGYYVYLLRDPRTSEIFYVGKGSGNRMFDHLKCAIENPTEKDKIKQILDISQKNQVEHLILRHNLTETSALEIESACIDLLGLENLTNEVSGHNNWERGLKSSDEIVQFYDAKVVTITEPTIIININKKYRRFMSGTDLYNTTRHRWVVGIKRNRAKYAIASYSGIVREIYEIQGWIQCEDGRWEFYGQVADIDIRDKYINQSLENYKKKGSQNPIRYSF